jgi:3-phenylpropionate/trans-cinnamate dioxygenase ferredoxin reductase subunit
MMALSSQSLLETNQHADRGAKFVHERVLVVGASLAGTRAAQTLRDDGFNGALTIVGRELHQPYRRPPLSKEVLAGTMDPRKLSLGGESDLDARWLFGRRASALDLARREVALDNGERLAFDALVIATGAIPRRLPTVGNVKGVHVLRTLDDATALRETLSAQPHRVVVVGAGFIGSEVASSCRGLGLNVTVVDPVQHPLAPLGPMIGGVCEQLQRDHGVDLRLGCSVIEVEGDGRVERVRLSDGTAIDADVVVVGVGVMPDTDWLRGSGLLLDNGVACDETLAAVGQDAIVAAGDVASWPHPLFDRRRVRLEHWSNAVEQGVAAAKRLLAGPEGVEPFATIPSMWTDQFGIHMQAVGLPGLADETIVIEGSIEERRFTAACLERGRVVGAVAFDMPRALAAAKRLVARRASVEELTIGTVGSRA